MAERIYKVEDQEAEEMTLVRTTSQGKAITHVVGTRYTCGIATGTDVADYIAAGGVIEETDPVDSVTQDHPDGEPIPNGEEGDQEQPVEIDQPENDDVLQ